MNATMIEEPKVDEVEKNAISMPSDSLKAFNPLLHNCTITLVSSRTGEHRVFESKTVEEGGLQGRRILSVKEGQDYVGFAFIDMENGKPAVWRKKQGIITYDRQNRQTYQKSFYEKCAEMFVDLSEHVAEGRLTVYVKRACHRCGRPLTDPESITQGIGPVCAKKEALEEEDRRNLEAFVRGF